MRRQRTSSWRRFDPEAVPRGAPAAVARVPGGDARPCRILGLDPGSLRTGFGIIDCDGNVQRHVASGCIRPPTGGSMALRLRFIYDAVADLVSVHSPAEIAIERVFMHRNPDSALKLGQARGVAMCAAALGGALVFEYAPRAVKLALVGHGGAEKGQVQHMVCAILALPAPQSLDASDALALGLCHGQTRRLGALLETAES